VARIGGRVRQISATSVGAVTQTTVAGAQPKSTSAATVKTNPSETPFASAPSTGTGKRSARVDATRNATTPTTVVVDPGSRAKKNVAAQNAATPTRETGATTASNLAGGSALPLITGYQVKFEKSQVKLPSSAAITTSRATNTRAVYFEFH
jgi:hypothetical protein